ncbi:AmmeMemoRadiSam system radical SAM enzyme [Desulfobacca acetoxidans]|uniref:Radical SAM domain protein n=1 Tax=Desulfobacca acetoxidans (strain ATCC 700848 / DSM 11109 / ASRB2) TaxID=880072 RepID=F2NI65_DESAR|nr:AmmeMemoRadiSam system radical SAM enzyme [Desulfobacca acetoxidans]AEB09834.1 Radical SAM domain protein [Desulfobacca acetoxidans DSM 11109]
MQVKKPSAVAHLGPPLTRRQFLGASALGLAALSLPGLSWQAGAQEVRYGFTHPHPAAYYTQLAGRLVRCDLCPRNCEVLEGDRGECGVRENRGGKYITLAYGNPTAVHIDPIEKKPLFHVLPGTASYSIATAGCNLHCAFCQNWEISQARPEETYNFDLPAAAIVQAAKETNCPSIAHTYVEPIIFYEYMIDIARLSPAAGIINVCHSAGYINRKPLEELCRYLQAACVDLKGFTEEFYQKLVGASLAPVLEALKIFRQKGVHLEIVNLIIPQFNDNPKDLEKMCLWIRDELGPLTPLHFSRFYPLFKMKQHYPTPVSTLEKAREIALKTGLKYVYLGNLPQNPAENTYCHHCGQLIISRRGYLIGEVKLKDGRCNFCGAAIPGIWRQPQPA